MWNDIYKPDSIGSEGGTIIADEEYKESCRITLERCERYDAITCGVYGSMMHTIFYDKSHSQEVFDNMKEIYRNLLIRIQQLRKKIFSMKSLQVNIDWKIGLMTGKWNRFCIRNRFS